MLNLHFTFHFILWNCTIFLILFSSSLFQLAFKPLIGAIPTVLGFGTRSWPSSFCCPKVTRRFGAHCGNMHRLIAGCRNSCKAHKDPHEGVMDGGKVIAAIVKKLQTSRSAVKEQMPMGRSSSSEEVRHLGLEDVRRTCQGHAENERGEASRRFPTLPDASEFPRLFWVRRLHEPKLASHWQCRP